MSKKIIIQLILSLIIIALLSIFYFQTKLKKIVENKEEIGKISKNDFVNIINNIEYSSSDEKGNNYTIKATYGEISNENKNLILMNNVLAVITINKNEKIIINSDKAIYNTLNYDTNFMKNVTINYSEHNLRSKNADILFNDNKIKIYNEIIYKNLNSNLLADIAEINLLTKDLRVYMNNNNKKINLTYFYNVNN